MATPKLTNVFNTSTDVLKFKKEMQDLLAWIDDPHSDHGSWTAIEEEGDWKHSFHQSVDPSDLTAAIQIIDNTGSIALDPEVTKELARRGFVNSGEWIFHPDHWKTDEKYSDGNLSLTGLDVGLTPITAEAVDWGVEEGMWSDEDAEEFKTLRDVK